MGQASSRSKFRNCGPRRPTRINGPNNSRVIFDLYNQNVLSVSGNGKPGIELVGTWLTAWIDLVTTDGQFVVNFYVCNREAESYAGDGKLGVILGGIAAD